MEQKVHELNGSEGLVVASGEVLKHKDARLPEIRDYLRLAGEEAVALVLEGSQLHIGVAGGAGVWLDGPKRGWVVPPGSGQDGARVFSGKVEAGQRVKVGEVEIRIIKPSMANDQSTKNIQYSIFNIQRRRLWGGVGSKLPKPGSGTVYLGSGHLRERVRKVVRMAGVGFVVAMAVLVGWGQIKIRQERARKAAINRQIEQVVADFEEAKELVGLNPVRSKTLAEQAKSGWEKLAESTRGDARLAGVEAELGRVLGAATGVRAANLAQVLDLTLVRADLKGTAMEKDGDNLLVVDTEGKRIARVDPAKKSGTVIWGQEALGEIELAASYPGKITVLSNRGILQCLVPSAECLVKIESDKEWGEVGDMAMFANNIYLLDKNKRQIWRYPVTEKGYGARQAWLREGTDLPGDARSLAIDGNIWVAGEGQIYKFVRGERDNFVISNLGEPLGKRLRPWVGEEDGDLYILDGDNQRLVVIEKDGSYKAQYRDERLGQAVDVVVDEQNKKAYILLTGSVWEIALQ